MKVVFELNAFFSDHRNGRSRILERILLNHTTAMSHIPHIGMSVNIGRTDDEISVHTIDDVTWVEEDDSLLVSLENYETSINENEDDNEWEYFDGIIEEFVEKDKWEVTHAFTGRENCKWIKK